MLFHEIYGKYFDLMAHILECAVQGNLTREDVNRIAAEEGFAESVLTIPAILANGDWLLVKADGSTPLQNIPTMPLSTLQKRWLKALLADPRIALFAPDTSGLEDVDPLYDLSDVVWFDRYLDSDPYTDPAYIKNFRTILAAIRENRRVLLSFVSSKGKRHVWHCTPQKLEYSSKDDKFRVHLFSQKGVTAVNLARIEGCSLLWEYDREEYPPAEFQMCKLTFELKDERNALERAMLAFSDLEKRTERLDSTRYRVELTYEKSDETELLIRVLAFGPMIRVTDPPEFIVQIKERIERQKKAAGR